MRLVIALVRLLPLAFMGRLAIAFTEIALAAFLVSSSVVVGHELRAWREWYWDPETVRPWAPTPNPSPTAATGLSTTAISSPGVLAFTSSSAPVVQLPDVQFRVAVGSVAAPNACRPPADNERLVFVRPVGSGADCVRTADRDDGVHLIVETNPGAIAEYGVVAKPHVTPTIRVFAPSDWPNPVLVVSGARLGAMSMLVVVTWQARSATRLFVGMGNRMDVAADAKGWPRVSITTMDPAPHIRTYGWDGNVFAEQ